MAAVASTRRSWFALAALLVLLAVAGASTLTVFEGPGCTRNTAVYSCGKCINIKYFGGYYFSKLGGDARLFSFVNCRGGFASLTDDTWFCNKFTYQSVHISCSSSPWDVTALE